jgi:hypothetical protein
MSVELSKDPLIAMQHIIDFISKNREWLFSGIGVLVVSWIVAILAKLYHWPSPRNSEQMVSDSAASLNQDSTLKSAKAPEATDASSNGAHYPRHSMIFYYESPPDPAVTEVEIKFLKVFSSLPRRTIARGYRLDYLYDLLRSKGISPSTAHILIRNLFLKGYLKQHTTERQTEYYALSDAAIRFLVAHGYVGIDYAPTDVREPSSDDGRGLS